LALAVRGPYPSTHWRNQMKLRLLSTLVLATLTAPMAHADVIFNNFGAGDTYNPGAWEVRGDLNISRIDRAKAFTPTQTYTVTSIELALYHETGGNLFSTLLCRDAGGEPGSILGGHTQPASAAPSFVSAIYTTPLSGITLNGGETYWVVVQVFPTSSDGGFWWGSSPTGDNGHSLYEADIVSGIYSWSAQPSSSAPVVRVSGTLVATPEPSALALLCLGIPALIRRRAQ
jgi:hypothetical protein